MIRDFYTELKYTIFKPSTFTIFNRLEEEGYINELNHLYNDIISIEDVEYYDIDLTEKESFLIRMYNNEFGKNIEQLQEKVKERKDLILKVDRTNGKIRLIKLKRSVL